MLNVACANRQLLQNWKKITKAFRNDLTGKVVMQCKVNIVYSIF